MMKLNVERSHLGMIRPISQAMAAQQRGLGQDCQDCQVRSPECCESFILPLLASL